MPAEQRASHARRLSETIVARRAEIARVVAEDTGKVYGEALMSDVLPTLEFLHYLIEHTVRLLRPLPARTPMLFRGSTSWVEHRPLGVVLVIAPWNNPFQLSLVPAMSALMAGNAVVLKPSERMPRTAALMSDLVASIGLESNLQVVLGDPALGRALVEEQPDMIFFTGSVDVGRAIQAEAVARQIPIVLELGGNDPMIVCEDANLERAARAVAYGAFAHCGQHCVSTKRLYVHRGVYEELLQRVVAFVKELSATRDLGRILDSGRAREQVLEAMRAGARLLLPGDREDAGRRSTLLADATHAMRVMREESFAPVLAAMPFDSDDEVVHLANDSDYGLNASIWTRNKKRGKRLAARLQTGNLFINNVLTNIGNPHLPFGGVKASGVGRYHGPASLYSFCSETAVMSSRSSKADEPNWLPYTESRIEVVDEMIRLRYGRLGFLKRMIGWLRLIPRM